MYPAPCLTKLYCKHNGFHYESGHIFVVYVRTDKFTNNFFLWTLQKKFWIIEPSILHYTLKRNFN